MNEETIHLLLKQIIKRPFDLHLICTVEYQQLHFKHKPFNGLDFPKYTSNMYMNILNLSLSLKFTASSNYHYKNDKEDGCL